MMSPDDFRDWRDLMGWSQKEAAERLFLNPRTVQNYEAATNPHPIPYAVELACHSLAKGEAHYVRPSREAARLAAFKLESLPSGWRSTKMDGTQKMR